MFNKGLDVTIKTLLF